MGRDVVDNKFLIGEMAQLHNVTVKTLRYYDEIDLLKPIFINEENGYRYYSTEQFEQLNSINFLKQLGFSLKEIKLHLDRRDIDDFLHLLEEQQRSTEKKMKELERINKKFQNRIREIKCARSIEGIGEPFIDVIKERHVVRKHEAIRSEPQLEVCLRQLENISHLHSSIFIGSVGLTISQHQIEARQFHEYNSVFILVEGEDVQHDLVTTIREGRYACIYFNGNHAESGAHYEKLLDYIARNNLTIVDDAIERTIIDHYVSERPTDYLTEIQIRIKD